MPAQFAAFSLRRKEKERVGRVGSITLRLKRESCATTAHPEDSPFPSEF
jgi:hypothetical protein